MHAGKGKIRLWWREKLIYVAYKMQNIPGAPEEKNELRQCSSLRREEKEKWSGGEGEKQKGENWAQIYNNQHQYQ